MKRKLLAVVLVLMALALPRQALAATMLGTYSSGYDADDVATEYLGFETYMYLDNELKAVLHGSTTSGGSGTVSNPNYPNYARFRNSLSSVGGNAISPDWTWYSSYNGTGFADMVTKARADLNDAFRWWDKNKGIGPGTSSGSASATGNRVRIFHADSIASDQRLIWSDDTFATISYDRLASGYSSISGYTKYLATVANSNYVGKNISTLFQTRYIYYGNDISLVCVMPTTLASQAKLYIASNTARTFYRMTKSGSVTTYSLSENTTSYPELQGYQYVHASITINSIQNGSIAYVITNADGTVTQPEYMPPDPEPPKNPEEPEAPEYQPTGSLPTAGNVTDTTNDVVVYELDLSPITDRLDVINDNLIEFSNLVDSWWKWLNATLEGVRDDMASMTEQITVWLQMIYDKIPSGNGTTPDPVSDDDGWWGWLDDLATILIGDLPSTLTGLTSAFQGLRSLFPFSVPWDLAAMLTLFVSEPVTPVVTIPWAFGVNQTVNITVDLTPYDGVAAMVRSVELVLFAAGLAIKTRSMLKNVEVSM